MPFDGPPQSSGNVIEGGVHVACAPSTIGCRSRVSSPKVSPSAEPLEQRRPKFAGWLLSPVMAAPAALSGVATTPQPTPQPTPQ
jgi:hypothetical protein